jgi:adenylate cyclase
LGQGRTGMSDVFVSYARSTEQQGQAVAEALKALGYSVWIDDQLPAHRNYSHVIEEELDQAKAVLVVWPAEAAKSDWVMDEAERAREQRKLVQVRLDRTRLPMPFGRIQCADLTGWTGDLETPGWRKVAAGIADLVGAAWSSSPSALSHALAVAEPLEPLLAVLAFDNLSGDPEMGYFSDGVSEEIQQTVAHGTGLKVIGRTSSFQLRGADKAVRKVVAELRATHVLDGSARRSGSRVRIATQLIECASETALWSDRFERDLVDVFALQDEIAAAVAAALKVVFAPAPKSEPIDPTAYELYLRARELGYYTDASAVAAAGGMLEQATKLAPKFARAWALLGATFMRQLRVLGTNQPYATMRAKVIEAAETALRLDARLGTAHVTLAGLEPVGRYAEREALFKKAILVAPNDPDVIVEAAGFYYSVGRVREALDYARRGLDLDPMNFIAVNTYACFLVGAGRYPESLALWEMALATWPDLPIFLSNAIGYAGNAAEWDRFDELVAIARERGLYKGRLRDISGLYRNIRSVDSVYIEGFLNYARDELDRTGNVQENTLAYLHEFGRADEAFDLIEHASFDYVSDPEKIWPGASNSGNIFSVSLHGSFLRDPRFTHLCVRLGLCDYWVKSDRWPDCADDGVLPYDFKAECRKLAGGSA